MAKITYEDGTIINFDGTPSPQDIEEAYMQTKGQVGGSMTLQPQLSGQQTLSPIGYSKSGVAQYDPIQLELAKKRAAATVPTAESRNMIASVDSQLLNIDTLEKQAAKLKGGYEGIWNRVIGVATRGGVQGDTVMYERKKPAYAAGLYRALTGDTRLSDQDASTRAYPLLWDTGLSKKLQKPMFDDLKNTLLARKIMLQNGIGGTLDKESGQFVTPIEGVMDMGSKIKKAKAAGYSEEEIRKFLGVK